MSELLARADAALFEAKRLGRDRVIVHDTSGQAIAATSVEASPDRAELRLGAAHH